MAGVYSLLSTAFSGTCDRHLVHPLCFLVLLSAVGAWLVCPTTAAHNQVVQRMEEGLLITRSDGSTAALPCSICHSAGRRYTYILPEGVDLLGFDLGMLVVIGLGDCQAACDRTSGCVVFVMRDMQPLECW